MYLGYLKKGKRGENARGRLETQSKGRAGRVLTVTDKIRQNIHLCFLLCFHFLLFCQTTSHKLFLFCRLNWTFIE